MRSGKPDIHDRVGIVYFNHQPIFVSTDVEHDPAPLQNAGAAVFLFDLRRIGPMIPLRLVKPGIQFNFRIGMPFSQLVQRFSRYYSHILARNSSQCKDSVPILGKQGVRQNSLGLDLTPALSSRRGRIIRRSTAKARDWICRMLIRKTRTVRLLFLLPGGEG